MRSTIEHPVRQGRTALKDDPTSEKAFGEMAARLNDTLSTRRSVSTSGAGGPTDIWRDAVAMPANSFAELQVKITGRSADGAAYFAWELTGTFFRGATGAAAQKGATQEKRPVVRSAGAITASIGVDADSQLYVQVDDGAVAAMDWEAWIEERRS